MPGPHSTRPGDVVKALNGKMVDITNTDAEGRLILADALTYAERLGATHLVDVATLTGAVARTLGELVAGAFGTPQPFVDDVFAASERAGERFWQLPLIDDYRADMESWYGDLVNFSRNNDGGLVKSALFISEFVTNSRRNSALLTSPPSLFREKFTRSPYQLSMSARYSSTSGSCQ